MKTKLLTIAVSVAALTGCVMKPTPYQPLAYAGGYTETHIHDNIYYVTFKANGFTDTGTAVKYFHRRSKELCGEKGFTNYRVMSEKDSSNFSAVYASTVEKPTYGGQIECVN